MVIGMPQNTGRNASGQWLPGTTGNAGGRPHSAGFAERVRKATQDGEDIIDFALKVRAGEVLDEVATKEGGVVTLKPPVKVRLDANAQLREWGYGKTPIVLAPEGIGEGASEADLLSQVIDAMDPAIVARVVAGKKLPKTEEAH